MKTLNTTLAIGLLAAMGTAQAETSYSANVAVASDYVWRGISQTGNAAAVSGGVDAAMDNGFYAGAWASNVAGGHELDLYAGYAGETDSFGYDLGVIHYTYNGTSSISGLTDFTELAASISAGVFSAGLNYTVAAEANGPALFVEGDIYYWASASVDLSHGFGLGGTIGHYTFDDDGDASFVGTTTDADYTHYQIDLTKGDFALSMNVADSDSADVLANPNGNDPLFFVSWSKSFE